VREPDAPRGAPAGGRQRRRIVVAISGASAPVYGIRLLEVMRSHPEVETHAIVSSGAKATIEYETAWKVADVLALADVVHDEKDLSAPLASGTFLTDGMIVAPCSMRTLGMIAHSLNENLIVRAADVHLKERRKLVLMVRETPLHAGHLKAMYDLSLYGAVILPPVPAFYHLPKTMEALIDHSVGKALDQLGVEHELFRRWSGPLPADER